MNSLCLKRLMLSAVVLLILSCSEGYVKENGHWVYVTYDEGVGKRVRNLEVNNFEFKILGNKKYGKDDKNVLYEGGVITGADPKSFEIIGNGYSKDNSKVYLDRQQVILADPIFFEVMKPHYSKDSKYIYCGTIPISVDRVDEFKIIEIANRRLTSDKEYFIKQNPDYTWLDTLTSVDWVIYGDGKGETNNERFEGFKKVESWSE